MAKLEHKNLLHYGDKPDVYAAFQRDFNRDTYVQMWWQFVLLGAAIGGVMYANHFDWLWLFIAFFATERAICAFIDNSNRNWAMHIIDWMENRQQE